jgi:hypothetical protein
MAQVSTMSLICVIVSQKIVFASALKFISVFWIPWLLDLSLEPHVLLLVKKQYFASALIHRCILNPKFHISLGRFLSLQRLIV